MTVSHTPQRASLVYWEKGRTEWYPEFDKLPVKRFVTLEDDNHFQHGDYWFSDLGHCGYDVYRNNISAYGDRNFGIEQKTKSVEVAPAADLTINGRKFYFPSNPAWSSFQILSWKKGFCKPQITENELKEMFD